MGRQPSTPLPLSWTELFDAQPLSVRLLLLLNSTLLLLLLLRPWILLLRLIPRKRRRPAKRAPHAPVATLSRRSAPPKLIRKDGEWPRVEPSELDPALCKAWQQLCAAAAAATAPEDATPEDAAIYGPVQPIEEYDTLRALKARRLKARRLVSISAELGAAPLHRPRRGRRPSVRRRYPPANPRYSDACLGLPVVV